MDISPVLDYFHAERLTCALFLILGVISLLLALYFLLAVQEPFYRGMAWSFIMMACIELAVCGTVFLRAPDDIDRVTEYIQNDRKSIQTEEIPRMEQVINNFAVYRWIQAALSIAGILLFFLSPPASLWRGVGLGLFIHSTLFFINDYYAAERAGEYLEYLKHIG